MGFMIWRGTCWSGWPTGYGEYSKKRERNPSGPKKGDLKMLRGGAWRSNAANLRVANRFRVVPGGSYDIGFRCARKLPSL